MNPHIFRQYDIRGIADRDLTDEVAERLGRAVGTIVRRQGPCNLALGRDCRLSSDRIHAAVTTGLVQSGVQVLDLGVVPTPVLYFSLQNLRPGGGVMITGSHNPAEYNGLKIAVGGDTLHGEQIQQLRRLAESGEFEKGRGSQRRVAVIDSYLDDLEQRLSPLPRPLRVVVDCGNGTASLTATPLFRRLGCEVIELYGRPDGSFPNHHPDPTVPENLRDLVTAVRRQGADLGVAFDGDADRIGAVDESGNVIWGDYLVILFARDILKRRPEATVVGEVKCSQNLYRDIEARGGRAIMWKAGHSLIKAKMKQEKAALAGEMSGHIFFADGYYGYDDATYAGGRLLRIVAGADRPLSTLLADLPPVFNTPEIRVDVPEEVKFAVVEKLSRELGRSHQTVTVDGVRVVLQDGWGLVRASNTQPALVLRFEADSPERLTEIREWLEEKVALAIQEAARTGS